MKADLLLVLVGHGVLENHVLTSGGGDGGDGGDGDGNQFS